MTIPKALSVTVLFAMLAAAGCVAQDNQVLLPAHPIDPSRHMVVFLGDSLTAGAGVKPAEAYPSLAGKFWREKGVPYVFLNAGVSGDTSANALLRVDGVVDSSTTMVVLAIGANDAFAHIPVETIKKNIENIIRKSRAKGSTVIVSSMYLVPQILGGDAEYAARFNALYAEVGRQEKVPVLPPLLRSIWSRADLWLPDHMHPTAEGHRLIAQDILRDLNPEWVYPIK